MCCGLGANSLPTARYHEARGTRVNAVRWWRQSDHFDWLTLYLNTSGIRLIGRAMIAVVIASIAVIPLVVLVRPTLPHYPAAFVVADTYPTADLHDVAEQLRRAIATTSYSITASIGITSAPLGLRFNPVERQLTDDLVNLADTAMYAAKHAGGNQSRSTPMSHTDLEGSPA